jgi:oxygen-independent coproporphyrinogen III oxidase
MFNLPGMKDHSLIHQFNEPGPYYTSYPTLSEWSRDITEKDYRQALTDFVPQSGITPIGLYIHFPFCPKQCYYCICNAIITKNSNKVNQFLDYLDSEMDMLFEYFERKSSRLHVGDIHLGGGSPSSMNAREFEKLMNIIGSRIDISRLHDFSIEVDPRTCSIDKLKSYHNFGITRVSFGIQDFNPTVQEAINRKHSFDMVQSLLPASIRALFHSVNFDVLYGLPLQTRDSFRETIELIKTLSPDRITLLRYAHVPESRDHQKLLDKYPMPNDTVKALLFYDAAENLKESGWEHIGIDHFVKPSDSLSLAQKENRMRRGFIGYTTGISENLLSLGPTSTIQLQDFYAQNVYSLDEYYEALQHKRFPIFRGYKLTRDDLIRRDIIQNILCVYRLNFGTIEDRYSIDFNEYFPTELIALDEFVVNGFLEKHPDSFNITDKGRYFLRHVCRVFDALLVSKNAYRIAGP